MRYLTLAAAAVLVLLIHATSASAAVSCTYVTQLSRLDVRATAAGDEAVLSHAGNGDLLVNGNICSAPPPSPWWARDDNLDTIVVTGADNGPVTVRVQDPAAFGPGNTPEGPLATSEIEIDLTELGGADDIAIEGSSGNDRFIVGSAGANVSASVLDGDADLTWGDPGSVTIDAADGDDEVNGRGGAGTGPATPEPLDVAGGDGADQLTGGSSADQLDGEGSADRLEGGHGADRLDGGIARDTIVYTHAAGGVRVRLDPAQPAQDTGPEGTDLIFNAERLRGGPHDDTLGQVDGDLLDGAAGNDRIEGGTHYEEVLDGGPGDDVIDPGDGLTVKDDVHGGEGSDTITYATVPVGVDVALHLAQANRRGTNGGDSVTQVENVIGTPFADHIEGDAGANLIDPLAGADEVDGREGDDALRLRDGEGDSALCGAGSDSVIADQAAVDSVFSDCELADFTPAPAPDGLQPPADQSQPPADQSQPPADQPAPPADSGVTLSLSASRAQRVLRTRSVTVMLSCAGEPCTARAAGKLGRVGLKTVTRSLPGDTKTTVRLRVPSRALTTIRRALARRRTPRIAVEVRATDAAGNIAVKKRTIAVK